MKTEQGSPAEINKDALINTLVNRLNELEQEKKKAEEMRKKMFEARAACARRPKISQREMVIRSLTEGNDVVDLKHATRINGVVDLWKDEVMIFCVPENQYIRCDSWREAEEVAKKLLLKHPKQPAFKRTTKGGMSYREFKLKQGAYTGSKLNDEWKLQGGTKSTDHLYIIEGNNGKSFKIGRSLDPLSRLDALQTGNASQLRLVLILQNKGCHEKLIHNRLNKWRHKGEWFRKNVILDEFIKNKQIDTLMSTPNKEEE